MATRDVTCVEHLNDSERGTYRQLLLIRTRAAMDKHAPEDLLAELSSQSARFGLDQLADILSRCAEALGRRTRLGIEVNMVAAVRFRAGIRGSNLLIFFWF